MRGIDSWNSFFEKLNEGTVLRYAAGLRHPVAAGYYYPFHEHAEIEIVFHPTGSGFTKISSGGGEGKASDRLVFAGGDAVIYAPRAKHDQTVETAGEDCCVQIAVPAGHGLSGALSLGPVDDLDLRKEIEFLAVGAHHPSPARRVVLNLRATVLMIRLLELFFARRVADGADTGRGERYVRAAELYVHENYAQIASIPEIARAAGTGGDHLRHLFLRLRRRTLVGYLNEVRVARAQTLLVHTPLSLKEIAAHCGWSDEYYFSSVFRKACGLAPGRYRENHLRRKQGAGRSPAG
jgi:AraC-like DNA-binding protein